MTKKNMAQKTGLIALGILLVLMSGVSLAEAAYEIPGDALSGGGNTSISSSYTNQSSIAEVGVVGNSSIASSGLQINHGFWPIVGGDSAGGDDGGIIDDDDDDDGGGSSGGGGCFIATAAYGTPLAREVRILSRFRDTYLLPNYSGQKLVAAYYKLSPPVAEYIEGNVYLKATVRGILRPVVWLVEKFFTENNKDTSDTE